MADHVQRDVAKHQRDIGSSHDHKDILKKVDER